MSTNILAVILVDTSFKCRLSIQLSLKRVSLKSHLSLRRFWTKSWPLQSIGWQSLNSGSLLCWWVTNRSPKLIWHNGQYLGWLSLRLLTDILPILWPICRPTDTCDIYQYMKIAHDLVTDQSSISCSWYVVVIKCPPHDSWQVPSNKGKSLGDIRMGKKSCTVNAIVNR